MLYNYNDDDNMKQNPEEMLKHEDPISYVNKQKKRRSKVIPITIFASVALLVGAVSGAAYYGIDKYFVNKESSQEIIAQVETLDNAEETKAKVSTVSTASQGSTEISDVSGVVESVMPSIVSVTNSAYAQSYGQESIFGYEGYSGIPGMEGQSRRQEIIEDDSEGTLEEAAAGTGIVVGQTDEILYVVTNYHVVAEADAVSITFHDEVTVDCEVKGYDSDSDLAVLAIPIEKISSETLSNIKVAVLGSSDDLLVGEASIAIGNALGYGQSVTTGVISALEREIQLTDSTMTLLQTDAAINPGNSGGALLNTSGEVIGINTVKYSSAEVEGMGYAIPISNAIPIIEELMNAESVPEIEQGYLGITGIDIDEQYQEMYGMPAGAYVSSVVEGSPAHEAGIVQGTIITKVAEKEIGSMEGLSNAIKNHRAGDSIEITVAVANEGSYTEKTVTVTLGSKGTAE